MPPLQCNLGKIVKLGKNVVVMYNSLFMSAGGITIEDGAMIAANSIILPGVIVGGVPAKFIKNLDL